MNAKKLLIIGTGSVAGHVLANLARGADSQRHRIWVMGRDEDKLRRLVNHETLVGDQLGYAPSFTPLQCDLEDSSKLARILAEVQPDIIFNTAVLLPYWFTSTLPKEIQKKLAVVQNGPWLPMDAYLILKLMRAVKASGLRSKVVNASYPDCTHPVLKAMGLAPFVGIGNVANAVPALRRALGSVAGVDAARLDVRLFGHHGATYALTRRGAAASAPYHLSVTLEGRDTLSRAQILEALSLLPTAFKRKTGVEGHSMTAASATRVLRALLDDTREIVHAPGFDGLPGGYALQFDRGAISVALPEGASLEQMVSINERGAKADGIESIGADGTVVFSAEPMEELDSLLGWKFDSMRTGEIESLALEFKDRLLDLRKQYA